MSLSAAAGAACDEGREKEDIPDVFLERALLSVHCGPALFLLLCLSLYYHRFSPSDVGRVERFLLYWQRRLYPRRFQEQRRPLGRRRTQNGPTAVSPFPSICTWPRQSKTFFQTPEKKKVSDGLFALVAVLAHPRGFQSKQNIKKTNSHNGIKKTESESSITYCGTLFNPN